MRRFLMILALFWVFALGTPVYAQDAPVTEAPAAEAPAEAPAETPPADAPKEDPGEASANWFLDTVPAIRWTYDWVRTSAFNPDGSLTREFYNRGPYVDQQFGGMFMVKEAEGGKPFVQKLFAPHDYEIKFLRES